ncbi:MAG: hypothetical protein WC279_14995 [Sulfurimonas sp.]|jgi:hypothetical protein|uniref:hypothetical protein n=1 Tax=Sulfurimonas sp. TaxID=2022749 RepID=UPI0035633392
MAKSEDNKDSKQERPQNVVPSPSYRIRVRVNGMGIVDENAASMEAALARADEIVAKGITQKVPNTRQTAVHPPHSIQRVEIEPLR